MSKQVMGRDKVSRVRVSDLRDQIGSQGPRPFLKCFVCGNESSANAGDYFMAPPDHVFRCCDRNMKLVTSKVVYTEARK